jgi:uncharacterized protein
VNRRGIASLGMKPFSGAGTAIKAGVLTPQESLRYAMSLPVTTTLTGMDKLDVVEQNLNIASNLRPMTETEMTELENRVAKFAADGRYEPYKVSLKFDNPEARLAHNFPLDMQSKEVKEMVRATENTGKPFPPAK